MTSLYVYGVIPSADRIVFDEAGMDDDHDEVFTLPCGALSAVVSASPIASFAGMKRDEAARYLVAHQRVVEIVMQHFAVLPVKFGTVLPDEDAVIRMLQQGEAAFRAALARCAGLVQMEVVALWDLREVFGNIGQDPRLAAIKARIAGKPAEETAADRVEAGHLVKALLEQRRTELADHLVPPLAAVGVDHVVNPVLEDSMVANVGLLLDQGGQEALDHKLGELDRAFGGRLTFRCVGPLPPYSFATVEVHLPSPEAIGAAREQLGVGEVATLSDIKRAYYQAASAVHPDRNPDGAGAEARMSALSQGYRLLTAFAESQLACGNGRAERACAFHADAITGTVIVAVRRQDLAPHSARSGR
jgi:hypothetical protein